MSSEYRLSTVWAHFIIFYNLLMCSWKRNTMLPTRKTYQMDTRLIPIRRGSICGQQKTSRSRLSINIPLWTLFASHARTNVTLRSWSWLLLRQVFKITLQCRNFRGPILILQFQPTVLPYSHLFDLTECSRFVSDYLFYQVRSKQIYNSLVVWNQRV